MKKHAFLAALILLFAISAKSQVPVSLMPIPRMQFFDSSGKVLPGCQLSTFTAGTSTPLATYVDSTGTSQNTNPIICDAGGLLPLTFLGQSNYKFVLKDQFGVQQWVVDNVNAAGLIALANSWTQNQTAPAWISSSANPATFGVMRAASGDQVCFRNNANTANLCLAKNVSDTFSLGPLTFPAGGITDTLVGKATTDTLTNKTIVLEAGGNRLTGPSKAWFAAAGCNNVTAASFWDLPTTTAAAAACVTGTNIQKGVLDYPTTAGGFSAQTTFALPADFSGNADFRLLWLTTAIAGSVKWTIFWSCTPANATATDDTAFANSTVITTAAPGIANQVQTSAATALALTGCSAGNILHLKVFRDGNTDTLAATARFYGLELTFRRAI